MNKARSQASVQASSLSPSGERSLEAADEAVEAWVKAESKLKDLEAVARESGRRLKGAQIYLERKGKKLLGKVSEVRRAVVGKELGQTEARVGKTVKEVESALGEQIKRPIKYKPPKSPRGPGGGPTRARAKLGGRGSWLRLPWRAVTVIGRTVATVAGPVSAGTAETEGEALGLSLPLLLSTRANLVVAAATISVLGGIELGQQQAKVKTETVNDMIGVGFASWGH